jgi:hypothetical protein
MLERLSLGRSSELFLDFQVEEESALLTDGAVVFPGERAQRLDVLVADLDLHAQHHAHQRLHRARRLRGDKKGQVVNQF